ncbi:MAG: hypothetical protein GX037_02180 [Trueperella sp.]|nr:hypothetical protein [Trueperella sp.]
MKKLILLFVSVATAGSFLAGCATSNIPAPTLPAATEGTLEAVRHQLVRIDISDGEACPVISHDSPDNELLLVFSGTAYAKNAQTLHVNGEDIKVGETFETGHVEWIEGGFTCGGTHYPQALHSVFE